ncbi:MAG TPA: type II toxin-antitoxin system HicA family toxin [Thermoanaerobaculia bacterium]|nr:type II toxin-antitoxin system HicA family toxin [Thermoanaerobaculia bacterium]
MTKVPSLNYPAVIAALQRAGWVVVRQRGSHIRLHRQTPDGAKKLTVPAHKPIKRSTLAKILADAELSVDDFLSLV